MYETAWFWTSSEAEAFAATCRMKGCKHVSITYRYMSCNDPNWCVTWW